MQRLSIANYAVWLAAWLALSGCALTTPQDDPVVLKLEEIERRLAAVERVLANGSLVDLTVQMDSVQRETARLRGQTEELQYNAESTATRQRDLYADIDERVRAIEAQLQGGRSSGGAVNVMDGGSLTPGQLPVPGGSDRDNYQAAFELIKEERYEQSALAFQAFLAAYPESQLADNAQYWLAESHYVTGQFQTALQQFETVTSRYPDSRKVPDALLKIGYCNYELQRWNDARAALTRVQSESPDTTAARLAQQRLSRMDEEGH